MADDSADTAEGSVGLGAVRLIVAAGIAANLFTAQLAQAAGNQDQGDFVAHTQSQGPEQGQFLTVRSTPSIVWLGRAGAEDQGAPTAVPTRDDDPGISGTLVWPVVVVAAPVVDADGVGAILGDEDPGQPGVVWPVAVAMAPPAAPDELAAAVSIIDDDDDTGPPLPPAAPAVAFALPAVPDELPSAAFGLEDDVLPASAVPPADVTMVEPWGYGGSEEIGWTLEEQDQPPLVIWPTARPVPLSPDADGVPSLLGLDEDPWQRPVVWPAPVVVWPAGELDEIGTPPTPLTVQDDEAPPVVVWLTGAVLPLPVADDEFPTAAPAPPPAVVPSAPQGGKSKGKKSFYEPVPRHGKLAIEPFLRLERDQEPLPPAVPPVPATQPTAAASAPPRELAPIVLPKVPPRVSLPAYIETLGLEPALRASMESLARFVPRQVSVPDLPAEPIVALPGVSDDQDLEDLLLIRAAIANLRGG